VGAWPFEGHSDDFHLFICPKTNKGLPYFPERR